jgi:hypothetical protein
MADARDDLEAAAAAYAECLKIDPLHMRAARNRLIVLEHIGGRAGGGLLAAAADAIEKGLVEFVSPWQRPSTFVSGLASRAWWDPRAIPLVKVLEDNAARIRQEVLAAVVGGGASSGKERETLIFSQKMRAEDAGWRRTQADEHGWRQVIGSKVFRVSWFTERSLSVP